MSERYIIACVGIFILFVAFVIGAGLIFQMMTHHKEEALHHKSKEKK